MGTSLACKQLQQYILGMCVREWSEFESISMSYYMIHTYTINWKSYYSTWRYVQLCTIDMCVEGTQTCSGWELTAS